MIRLHAALMAGALLLGLTACGSTTDRVNDALDSAASATASARTVLAQLDDGKALPAYADTVLGDALTELGGAEDDLRETGPIGSASDVRDNALAAIRNGTDAVLAARETVASGGAPASDLAAIDAATDELHALRGTS